MKEWIKLRYGLGKKSVNSMKPKLVWLRKKKENTNYIRDKRDDITRHPSHF